VKFILNFFSYLAQSDEYHERKRREAYLSQSVSISDLENRMRELDRENRVFPWMTSTRP
jgi:Protein of unknown function (DUF3563)